MGIGWGPGAVRAKLSLLEVDIEGCKARSAHPHIADNIHESLRRELF